MSSNSLGCDSKINQLPPSFMLLLQGIVVIHVFKISLSNHPVMTLTLTV